MNSAARLVAALEVVMRNYLCLHFFEHDLLLYHDNLFFLGRGLFLRLVRSRRSLPLDGLGLLDEMDFLLRVLGIIRHILPLCFLVVAIFETQFHAA